MKSLGRETKRQIPRVGMLGLVFFGVFLTYATDFLIRTFPVAPEHRAAAISATCPEPPPGQHLVAIISREPEGWRTHCLNVAGRTALGGDLASKREAGRSAVGAARDTTAEHAGASPVDGAEAVARPAPAGRGTR